MRAVSVHEGFGGIDELSTDVITTIADHEGVDPMDLEPPLYEVVDLDALEMLFDRDADVDGRFVFSYNGYDVTVTSDGDVRISP